jgi:hypothetical protein
LVLAWCSNFAVSLSLIQVYKYLKNIIRLPKNISLLILSFFAFFTTNILLSFTPETYTYTLFFLVLFNYYAALKLKKEAIIPARTHFSNDFYWWINRDECGESFYIRTF